MSKDRYEALYDFWSGFGIPAYEENNVPENAAFPYITYESTIGSFESVIPLSASIWDRTTKGTAFIDTKADEIEQYISSMNDCPIIKNGRYRVFIEGPFASNMGDPDDKLIKRKHLNVYFEFMTTTNKGG